MGLYRDLVFSRIMDWALGSADVASERRAALAQARGRVLEIGFGTGLNLPHYPPQVSRLTVVDPARMLESRVARRIALAHMPVEVIRLDAGGKLPFRDDSFDSVVTTFTLCSISAVSSALDQIRRVLHPEGRFIFLEHGRSDDPSIAKRQDRLNPFHKIVACGCNINRPIDRLVEEAGLDLVELDRFLMPGAPRVSAEMYRGTARKREGE